MAAPQFPNYRNRSARSQTFWTSSGGEEPVTRSEMNTPPADMRESTARYATYDLAWGAWENLGPMGEGLYMNVDWWDMNQF